MAFTNPCEGCSKNKDGDCSYWSKCGDYRYWLNYNWKMARTNTRKPQKAVRNTSKWVYHHPDDVKKYLIEGVCNDCPFNEGCNDPCQAYLDWYNARMEAIRKVAGV